MSVRCSRSVVPAKCPAILGKIVFSAVLILSMNTINAHAYSTKAKAKGRTLYAVSTSSPSGMGTGKFHLGDNKAKITGHGTDTTGRGHGYYEDFEGSSSPTYRAHNSSSGIDVTAESTIHVGYYNRGWYDWELDLFAEVERSSRSAPKGKAKAKGDDPQYFDPASLVQNPIFRQDFSLLPGTAVYSFDPSQEWSWLTVDGTTSLLSQPVFSIDIRSLGQGAVDATVAFNQNPHLKFSTKPSVLEAMIENPQYGVGTDEGLTQMLSFTWSLDTSAFKVTGYDWVGGGMEANAIAPDAGDFNLDGEVDGRDFLEWQRNPSLGNLADWQTNYGALPPAVAIFAVPEPATLSLGLFSLVVLGRGRGRLNSV